MVRVERGLGIVELVYLGGDRRRWGCGWKGELGRRTEGMPVFKGRTASDIRWDTEVWHISHSNTYVPLDARHLSDASLFATAICSASSPAPAPAPAAASILNPRPGISTHLFEVGCLPIRNFGQLIRACTASLDMKVACRVWVDGPRERSFACWARLSLRLAGKVVGWMVTFRVSLKIYCHCRAFRVLYRVLEAFSDLADISRHLVQRKESRCLAQQYTLFQGHSSLIT